MEKAKAIEYLEDCRSQAIHDGVVTIGRWRTDVLDMAIDALREQEQSKWISVKERLPVGEGRVLCVSPSGVYRTLDWNSTFECWFDLHGYSFKKGVVTHWMPLPEPPEGGAE